MLTSTIFAITALAGSAAAHYKLLAPAWRGDSFEEPASQWIFPCKRLHLHLITDFAYTSTENCSSTTIDQLQTQALSLTQTRCQCQRDHGHRESHPMAPNGWLSLNQWLAQFCTHFREPWPRYECDKLQHLARRESEPDWRWCALSQGRRPSEPRNGPQGCGLQWL